MQPVRFARACCVRLLAVMHPPCTVLGSLRARLLRAAIRLAIVDQPGEVRFERACCVRLHPNTRLLDAQLPHDPLPPS